MSAATDRQIQRGRDALEKRIRENTNTNSNDAAKRASEAARNADRKKKES